MLEVQTMQLIDNTEPYTNEFCVRENFSDEKRNLEIVRSAGDGTVRFLVNAAASAIYRVTLTFIKM